MEGTLMLPLRTILCPGRRRARFPDLVVLGAQHSPFPEFTTLGATTERVIRHSPCSVLLVPWKDSRLKGRQ
jgi:hypothetical protein